MSSPAFSDSSCETQGSGVLTPGDVLKSRSTSPDRSAVLASMIVAASSLNTYSVANQEPDKY